VRDLNRCCPDTAGGPRDEHARAFGQLALGYERVVRGREGLRETTGLAPVDVLGHEREVFDGMAQCVA